MGGLAFGSLLFLIAAGFTLVLGLMRVINAAQTSFFLVGTYVGLSVLSKGGQFWLAALAAGVSVALLGLLVYHLLLHRHHADELTTMFITLGLSLVLGDGALVLWGGDPQSVRPPPSLRGPADLGFLVMPKYWLFLIAISAIIFLLLWLLERRTLFGAIIRAGVDDEEMTRGLGINVDRVFLAVFTLGAFLAGLGGMLGGPFIGAYPRLDQMLLPLSFAVVIVGGMGSVPGAFIASLVIGVVNNFGQALFPELAYFTIFAPVAIIMAWRPSGLLGRR